MRTNPASRHLCSATTTVAVGSSVSSDAAIRLRVDGASILLCPHGSSQEPDRRWSLPGVLLILLTSRAYRRDKRALRRKVEVSGIVREVQIIGILDEDQAGEPSYYRHATIEYREPESLKMFTCDWYTEEDVEDGHVISVLYPAGQAEWGYLRLSSAHTEIPRTLDVRRLSHSSSDGLHHVFSS